MKFLFILLFVGGLVFEYAFACQCVADITPTQRLADSNAVFIGKVTDVDTFQDQVSGTTLEVQQSWKGISTSPVHVSTWPSTDCNFEFVKDEVYLVYSYGKDSLSVNACSGTKLLSDSYEDLKVLGPATIHIVDLEKVCLDGDECPEQKIIDRENEDVRNFILVSTIGIPSFGALIGFVIWNKRKNK